MMLGLGLTFVIAATVTVDRREVTVGDLLRRADGTRFAGSDATLVVFRLPPARRRIVLSGESVVALVRRRLPTLPVTSTGPATIALRQSVAGTRCWTTVRALAAGEPVTRRDVAATPCGEGQASAAMRTARDGTIALTAAQPAGTALGRLLPAPAARIARGTTLTLRSVHGPVAIERPVTTIQPGQSGKRVFVRDEQGRVFAAPLAIAEEPR